MGRDLILRQAGAQELHRLPVSGVTDGADDTETFLFVHILDGTRFHHRRHTVGPVDAFVFERLDDIDIDEIDTDFPACDIALFHFLRHGLRKLADLLGRSGSGCTFDPGVGVTNVFLRDPGAVALDLCADVALLEDDRWIVTAEHRVT